GDAGGKDDGAATVVDLAALAGHLGAVVDLPMGALDEVVAAHHLPVAEADGEAARADREHDQEQEQAAPRIRPTAHGLFRSLASLDDEWRPELAEPGVERLLADGGLAPEPLHVRLEVLADRLEPILLRGEPDDVVARRRDTDALAERKERGREHDHDRGERDSHGRRPAGRDRPGSAAAGVPVRAIRHV